MLAVHLVLFFIPAGTVFAQPGTLTFVEYVKDDSNGVDGLDNVFQSVFSGDGSYFYATSRDDSAITVFARNSSTGALTFMETHKLDSAGVQGLGGAASVVLSPDGEHLYVASIADSAIAVFSRDVANGTLTFVERMKDDSAGVDGLAWTHDLIISPDGSHVYASGYEEHEVAIFSRNQTTGALTFIEIVKDDSAGVDGLQNTANLTISPDGLHVYVTGRNDNAIAVFSRSAVTGLLTFVEIQKDDSAGVSGMENPNGLDVSPDGAHVYVMGMKDSSLVVFSRDYSTGALTFVEKFKDDSAGVDGLSEGYSVIVSPDGAHVYTASLVDSALAVFSRDASTGALTFIEVFKDDSAGVSGLDFASHVIVSPDGNHVYVSGAVDDAVAIFSRSQPTPDLAINTYDYDFGSVAISDSHAVAAIRLENVGGLGQVTSVSTSNPVFSVATGPAPIDINPGSAVSITIAFAPTAENNYSGTITLNTDDPGNATFVINVWGDGVITGDGKLTFAEVHIDDTDGVDGLLTASGVAVSPEGDNVYATGLSDAAVAVFQRHQVHGYLTFLEFHKDGVSGVDGLGGAKLVRVAPDGEHVYVIGQTDNAIAIFDRSDIDGALTFVVKDTSNVASPLGLALSPDGANLYTTSQSNNSIQVFARNATDGTLSFLEEHTDGSNGVNGLNFAVDVQVSRDGLLVYATGNSDNALAVFQRNPANGRITFLQVIIDGLNSVDGLSGAQRIAVSPDDRFIVVTTNTESKLAVFQRNVISDTLDFLDVVQDAVGGVTDMSSPDGLTFGAEGHHLYVAADGGNSVNIFDVDNSGVLTHLQVMQDDSNFVDGLWGAEAIAASADGRHVYVAGSSDNMLAHFQTYEPVKAALPSFFFGGPGDTVTASLVIENLIPWDSVSSFDMTFSYPDSLITFQYINTTGFLADGMMLLDTVIARDIGVTEDTLIITAADSQLISGDGTLLELVFVVDSNSVNGETALVWFEEILWNEGFPLTVVNDGFFENAREQLWGDVDGDGLIQAVDASQILQYNVRKFIPVDTNQTVRMDPSGNEEIRAFDAALVLRHVAGIITTFPAGSTFIDKPAVMDEVVVNLETTSQAEQELTIAVQLDYVSAYSAAELSLEYDPALGEYLGAYFSDGSDEMMWSDNAEEGVLTVAMASAESRESDGVLAHLRFRLLEQGVSQFEIRLVNMYLDEFQVVSPANAVTLNGLPRTYALSQNYPNPFNPVTTIRYQIPEVTPVAIAVYNMLGQKIAVLVDEQHTAGYYTARWDGRNAAGLQVASGVYLMRMEAGTFMSVRKMLLLK